MNLRCWLLIVLVLLAGCSKPTVAKSGGTVLVYRLAPNQTVRPEEMAVALQQRLVASGFSDASVTAHANGVRIELPGSGRADVSPVKTLLTKPGQLEFLICAERGSDDKVIGAAEDVPNGEESAEKGYRWIRLDAKRVEPDSKMVVRKGRAGREEVLMLVDREFSITGADFREAHATVEGGVPCIAGALSAEGGHKMGYVTANNLKKRLGIVLDGELLSAPIIQSKITDRFQLTGRFSQQEVDTIVAMLRSGTLPGRLEAEPASEEYVEPKK